MTIFVIITALLTFTGQISLSFKGKEFYYNETFSGHSPEIIGAIFESLINLLPWYLMKVVILLFCGSIFIACMCYLILVIL
ncbi:hypothetical protein BED47_03910 [Gottfriedia luciferensis]|uniref:Uncharacterized protein n=1 Tax=Gottfriedia luciferensis TaxID=178774 RepID=A0ABX2ZUL8_9BACI|nr:hypothetical protein [Gottfriedia luciferensis]ODG93441.1 hypothetical protein BED47_03910 [Gottfriedia luciferensis]